MEQQLLKQKGYNFGFPVSTAPVNCTKAERGIGFQDTIYVSTMDVEKTMYVNEEVPVVSKEKIENYYAQGEIGWLLHLANGEIMDIANSDIEMLASLGEVALDLSWARSYSTKVIREQVKGEVRVPTPVMITIYYDKNGNILDEDGTIK